MKKNLLLITITALLILNMNCFAEADNANDDKNIITKTSIETVAQAENIDAEPAGARYETVTPNETSVTGKRLEEMQNIAGGIFYLKEGE